MCYRHLFVCMLCAMIAAAFLGWWAQLLGVSVLSPSSTACSAAGSPPAGHVRSPSLQHVLMLVCGRGGTFAILLPAQPVHGHGSVLLTCTRAHSAMPDL